MRSLGNMAEDTDVPNRKTRDPILMIGTIVLALAFVVVSSSYVYGHFAPDPKEPVRYGDSVRVDYVGSFYGWYDGFNDSTGGFDGAIGVVFDTSLRSVASDGDKYPKSWEFREREERDYMPLDVTVGSGGALADFEKALIGMVPGESKYIMIPKGYGDVPEANIRVWEKSGTMNLTETISVTEFEATFGLTNANGTYTNLLHPYGWKSDAWCNQDGTVVVHHLVENGKTYTVNHDMTITVSGMGSGKFNVTFDITVTNVPDVGIKLIEFKSGGQTFFITDVGNDFFITKSGTGSRNEVIGMDLYFKITLVGYQ